MGIAAILGGPTAAGKSSLALRWARARGFEILSADSRQIYRGFSIGTGAPLAAETREVKHHLVASADPRETFSPKRFREEALKILRGNPKQQFLLVGGTGLYIKELLYPGQADRGETPAEIRVAAKQEIDARGLPAVHADLANRDPEGMRAVHPHDRYRIQKRLENLLITGRSYVEFQSVAERDPDFAAVPLFWIKPPRAKLHQLIETRIRNMESRGWLDEVKKLLQTYDPESTPAFNALGYREMAEVAWGRMHLEAALNHVAKKTRQYARRQTTFFRHQFLDAVAADFESLRTGLEASNWDESRLAAHGGD